MCINRAFPLTTNPTLRWKTLWRQIGINGSSPAERQRDIEQESVWEKETKIGREVGGDLKWENETKLCATVCFCASVCVRYTIKTIDDLTSDLQSSKEGKWLTMSVFIARITAVPLSSTQTLINLSLHQLSLLLWALICKNRFNTRS